MVVTNIDVQSIEPVDTHMRDSLHKSVQLTIEISTMSIELEAQHEASRTEQDAKGSLHRQKLENEKAAEAERKQLYSLRAVAAAVESSGQTKAEAEAKAQKSLIEGLVAVDVARLKMEAKQIEDDAKRESLKLKRNAEVAHKRIMNQLEMEKQKRIALIETEATRKRVEVIGASTIRNIAQAGPSSKVRMLEALGIRSTVITGGNTPLNLYQSQGGNIGI